MPRSITCHSVRIAGRTVTEGLLVLGVCLAEGCAARSTSEAALSPALIRIESSRYSIGQPELSAATGVTADDVIRSLRPEWLRANPTMRRADPTEYAVVYAGNSYLGSLDVLHLVQTAEVRTIQYLTPMEARGRFGPSCRCTAGAILLVRVGDSRP